MGTHALVGCGGIGYHLAEAVARNLKPSDTLWFIDGDIIDTNNLDRQFYPGVVGTSKARALKNIVSARFPDLVTHAMDEFINHSTANLCKGAWLKNGVTVWVCVDSDPTRVFIQQLGEKLDDVTLIVGGNDETTGQAQAFVRRNAKNITPTIVEVNPELLEDKSEMPSFEHCLEHAVSEPQTATVNRAVGVAMEMLHRIVSGGGKTNEIRVDIRTGNMAAFTRPSLLKKKRSRRA